MVGFTVGGFTVFSGIATIAVWRVDFGVGCCTVGKLVTSFTPRFAGGTATVAEVTAITITTLSSDMRTNNLIVFI